VGRLAVPTLLSLLLCSGACDRRQPAVLFVGDSLTTIPLGCEYPRLWTEGRSVRPYTAGVFGSTAKQWRETGRLGRVLALRHPDIVVIALGTNDARQSRLFSVIVEDLRALYDEVQRSDGHPKAYVATVPPMYDPPEGKPIGAPALRTKIDAINQFIRIRFPRDRIVDFDSWMPKIWSADVMLNPGDGVHMGCGGQRRRAEHVAAVLDL